MTKKEKPILVRVVDDDPQLLKAIGFFLDTNDIDNALYSGGTELLEHADLKSPGCLILDVMMPGMSGPELQKVLNKKEVTLPIIFLTAFGDLNLAVSVFRNGAIDFLQKPFQPYELLEAVDRAVKIDKKIRSQQNINTPLALYESLTRREEQVLRDVSHHSTNKLTAEHLGLSERTVEFHRFSGLKKLGLKKVDELVDFFDAVDKQKAAS